MRRHTATEKLRAVRLHLEEGFTHDLVCQELGVGKSSLEHWLKAYRLGGEALVCGSAGPAGKTGRIATAGTCSVQAEVNRHRTIKETITTNNATTASIPVQPRLH